jgi:hypothetical protein
MPATARARLLLLAIALLATACVRLDGGAQTALGTELDDVTALNTTPTDEPTVEPPQPGEDLEVPLDIVEGAEGSTLAFVPVMIGDQGPFAFALDTGASNSVLDEAIAERLGLQPVGDPRGVTGVAGDTEAHQVQIPEWRTGDIDLGARPVIALDLSGPNEGAGIQGLLGSDVLSAFGAVTVDYDAAILRLRPREAQR